MLPIWSAMYVACSFVLSYADSGWTRVLPSLLAPALTAGFLWWRPYDPYQFHRNWQTGVSETELSRDLAAMHLRRILRSNDARAVPWKVTPLVSLLSLLLACGWFFVKPAQDWTVNLEEAVIATGLWAVVTLGLYLHILMIWGLDVWRKTQSG
jgi:hypothetical protein